jgi:tRNA-2-methylthio-N6-dimethylallyladenosine synthase
MPRAVDVKEEELVPNQVPYLDWDPTAGKGRSVFVETYGCQMNVSDTEIVYSIMNQVGYTRAKDPDQADIIFLNTCAVREHAEHKIWTRLGDLRIKRKGAKRGPVVGVLGCMAERLKEKLLEEEKIVDIVAGPDSYRDLPRLLSRVTSQNEKAMNVMLSADETYADISPVREDENGVSAYVYVLILPFK